MVVATKRRIAVITNGLCVTSTAQTIRIIVVDVIHLVSSPKLKWTFKMENQ